MTFSATLFPAPCCYFLCNFGFIFPVLFLLLFSSLFFYALLYRSLAIAMAQWPFRTSLAPCHKPQCGLQCCWVLSTEKLGSAMSEAQHMEGSLVCVTWESSAIPLLGCMCHWPHAGVGCQEKKRSLQLLASLTLLFWPQAKPSCKT